MLVLVSIDFFIILQMKENIMEELLIIFLILLICFPVIVIAWYNTAEQKGKRGEQQVHSLLLQLSNDYYLLNNLVFRTAKGTTQIDHVVISKYGVFVIETKNYSGEIYGDDNRDEWTQIIANKVRYRKNLFKEYTYITKNHLYNPVKQSLGHVYVIKKQLNQYPYLKIVPIVVFIGSASIEKVNSKYHVVYGYELLTVINQYKTIYLSDQDVQDVIKTLLTWDVSEFVDTTEHVKNINAAKQNMYNKINSGICPRCGGKLVRREGKYGTFYGCSNYPKCRYIAK